MHGATNSRAFDPAKRKEKERKGKERKGKERKGKERLEYALRRQFIEKPGIIPGCPGTQ
jgi:hypothetical protein